ncbi:MAG: hypothetical protein ACRDWX_05565 [Acidimicrobiia bacterium]
MRRLQMIVGSLLAVGGAVWILQGLNVAFTPQSFMTGNRQWVIYGGLAMVLGLVIVGSSMRRA